MRGKTKYLLMTAALAVTLLGSACKPASQPMGQDQEVTFVVEAGDNANWMTVRVYQLAAEPNSLGDVKQTPLMTVRPWSYSLTMVKGMYVSVTPLFYQGDAGDSILGDGVCYVLADGVEVPGSRHEISPTTGALGYCDYQVIEE